MKTLYKKLITAIAVAMLWLITSKKQKANNDTMAKMEFRTSTKKMGLRFTEKIRNQWRYRWLKIKR
ncbi:MAG: hypothetical protein JEZ07_11985 [Phycisphaerae bacterium]|nr:hypothetical protein [Phycisphaerae bacterium]